MVSLYYDARLMHKIGKWPKLSWYGQQCGKDPSFDYKLVHDFPLQCWVYWLQWWTFYNTRHATTRKSSASDTVDFSGKLLDTWTSWQLKQHGSLGPLDLLGESLDSWHLGPFGNFDILWSLWWFKLLRDLFGSFLGKHLNSWCFGSLDNFLATFPPERSFGYLPQILSLHN